MKSQELKIQEEDKRIAGKKLFLVWHTGSEIEKKQREVSRSQKKETDSPCIESK